MPADIRSFRDLEVWQRAVDLVIEAYQVAHRLPRSEQFELSSQVRRAAVSIPANIAEGHARRGKTYLNCVRIAIGSLAELDTHVEVALRLKLLNTPEPTVLEAEIVRVGQMLHALARSLRRRFVVKTVTGLSTVLVVAAVWLRF